jgi:hypothetical protein
MNITELIDRYCEVWTEIDSGRREELLKSIWAANATYTDPTVHTTGAAELLSHIGKVQASRHGAKILRTSAVDFHHGVARFAWHLLNADGRALPDVLDIAFLTPDGERIQRIVGFFGPLKSLVT